MWKLYSPNKPQKIVSQKKVSKEFIAQKFTFDKTFENFIFAWKIKDDAILENYLKINKENPTLSIVVGESGIGKTACLCKLAQTLRKEGHLVYFISPEKTKKFDVNIFFLKYFGINNSDEISKQLVKNFYSQVSDNANTRNDRKTPVLIIDNIDYCKDGDGKIDSTLLTFLNNNVYQQVPMSVIMVTSNDRIAYEINDGISYLFI